MKINRPNKRPKSAIAVWKPGELLMASRKLAQLLRVSRSTLQIVYEELLTRGCTVTSRRSGTRVSRHLPIMEQVTLAHFIEHGYFMRICDEPEISTDDATKSYRRRLWPVFSATS